MKLVVTSDWHFSNNDYFARPWKDGLTSRCETTLNFISWLGEFCENEEVEGILHCGDMFHQRSPSTPVFNAAYDALAELVQRRWMVVIPGNHDRHSNLHSVHSLHVHDRGLANMHVLTEDTPLIRMRTPGLRDLEVCGIPGGQ